MIVMAKKHLLPDENQEFLDRLGLTEIDKKVYIATLDGGLVSAGEIQQFTEIQDLGKILESIRDMVDLGLIKKARGSMPRYYATLPFFRETLSVEQEFKFALESMLHSLTTSKEETVKNRELILATRFPKIIDELLDSYYHQILNPVVKDLEAAKEKIKDDLMPFIKEVESHNQGIKEEMELMLKPLTEFSALLTNQFDKAILEEGGRLRQYIDDRKNFRLNLLKNAHTMIGESLGEMKKDISTTFQNLRNLQLGLEDHKLELTNKASKLGQSLQQSQHAINQASNAKKEVQAELVVAREQIKRFASNDKSAQQQVDQIFQTLTDRIKAIEFGETEISNSMNSAKQLLEITKVQVDTVSDQVERSTNEFYSSLNESFDDLKKTMTTMFTTVNDTDDASLDSLEKAVDGTVNSFHNKILEDGNSIRDKLNAHINSINSQVETTLSRWQEHMIGMFDRPIDTIHPFLEKWIDDIAPLIDEFKQKSEGAMTEILKPIVDLENGTFSVLTERIGFIKAMVEGRSSDLQQVMVMARNFDFTKTSDTWVVLGLPAIYASLTDLLLRTRNRVTIITPQLDLELAEVARTLKNTIRITIVTAFDPEKDARLVKKLEDTGRIILRHYPDRDLYACIRDSEELVFGYIRDGEETMGIRASTPSIVQLIEDRFNETVIRNSKQI